MSKNPWLKGFEDEFSKKMSERWLAFASNPSLLLTPRLTVPEIQKACKITKEGWSKVAAILLAVRHAVNTNLLSAEINELQSMALYNI